MYALVADGHYPIVNERHAVVQIDLPTAQELDHGMSRAGIDQLYWAARIPQAEHLDVPRAKRALSILDDI